jgi:hypothetical protein
MKSLPLRCGNLQDGGGASVGNDPPCGDFAVDSKRGKRLVEEIEVEREAHAEGVDARTAGDEQARACLHPVEKSEAKQAGLEAHGDGDLPAEHGRNPETAQAQGTRTGHHAGLRIDTANLSPHHHAVAVVSGQRREVRPQSAASL